MITRELLAPRSVQVGTLKAAIFDVDGVLLASPHERAWALRGFADSERFTTAMYQADVAGKPRLSGALAALGVPDAAGQAAAYAARKQKRLEELIAEGAVKAFPDALRFVQAVADLGWPMAVASTSAPDKACSTFSAPMSAGAICRGASRIQRFFCWRLRNCTSIPSTVSLPRTPRPGSRQRAPATWRGSASPVRATPLDCERRERKSS